MLNELKTIIRGTDDNSTTDFWLNTESCNKLIEEAENVRLREGGIFELNFNNGDVVGLKTEGTLFHGNSKAYVKVAYLNDEYKPIANAKNCKVL